MLKDLKSKNLKKFFAKALIGAVVFGGVFLFSVNETQAGTICYSFNEGFPNADAPWNGSSDTTQTMPGWLVVQGISETDIMINNLDIAGGSLPPSGVNHLTFYDADDGFAGPPETNDIACVPIDLSGFASVKIGYYWQTDDPDVGEGYRSAYSTDATSCTNGTWTLID